MMTSFVELQPVLKDQNVSSKMGLMNIFSLRNKEKGWDRADLDGGLILTYEKTITG